MSILKLIFVKKIPGGGACSWTPPRGVGIRGEFAGLTVYLHFFNKIIIVINVSPLNLFTTLRDPDC